MESGVICEKVCGHRVATLHKSTCVFRVKRVFGQEACMIEHIRGRRVTHGKNNNKIFDESQH